MRMYIHMSQRSAYMLTNTYVLRPNKVLCVEKHEFPRLGAEAVYDHEPTPILAGSSHTTPLSTSIRPYREIAPSII